MIFVKQNSLKALEGSVAALRDRAGQLAAKHAAAKAECDVASTAQQALLLRGDLDDVVEVAAAQSRVTSTQSSLSGLSSAIDALAVQIKDAERDLAAEKERVARRAASASIAREIKTVEQKVSSWCADTQGLAKDLEWLGLISFEADGIAKFMANAASQVEIAMPLSLAEIRREATGIADGQRAIPNLPPPRHAE